MGYNTANVALSGMNSAAADMAVSGNNIANVNTIGFKKSRAEFGDIFSTTSGKTSVGSGVLVNNIAQQFGQGNLAVTENTLDMAINGNGFFVVTTGLTSNEKLFARAGQFAIEKDGYITNANGQYLHGFPVDSDGNITSTALATTVPLNIPPTAGTPKATTEVDIGVNLNSSATGLVTANFDPASKSTYTSSTSLTVYDSLGASHKATIYFISDAATANSWETRYYIDGTNVTPPAATALGFSNSGVLTTPVSMRVTSNAYTPANGAQAFTVAWDFNNSTTQYASAFTISRLQQDGFSIGQLTGVDVDEGGVVQANFTNGTSKRLGVLAAAKFNNLQGLRNLGNNTWGETLSSGTPVPGEAASGSFGQIRAGSVENSNVDLTEELVRLIAAQRNFQANARSIEVSSEMAQRIMNIR